MPKPLPSKTLTLQFHDGCLITSSLPKQEKDSSLFLYDERTRQYRAKASSYRDFILEMKRNGTSYEDKASHYEKISLPLKKPLTPRPHQTAALEAWMQKKQGVVVLPTGAGKTILAVLVMSQIGRSTLIIVPTIDLLNQWCEVLSSFFDEPIGALGGGERQYENIMVATYDSARLMIESKGNRFGLLIVDECHRLPSSQNRLIAEASLAPFRLGLTATVERQDGAEELLYELLGDLVYEAKIGDMVEKVLAPYDVVRINALLSAEEKAEYQACRSLYTNFLRQNRINFSQAGAWQQFIIRSNQSPAGREAFRAYHRQKKIPQWAEEKFHHLWNILLEHTSDSLIIFTDDNQVAYRIARTFFIAAITHKTKAKERKKLLEAFRAGNLKALVTSRVLNEGVDVPEARVGVVFSGTGAVREHVQRLGRILRNRPGKRAILYELVTADTNEQYVNERRRMHHAYQSSP